MKLITSTHYNRPTCTQLMIEHLLKCTNAQDYHVVFFIEPGCPDVAKIINECPLNKTVHQNTKLLGCWENKKQAINHGFENANYVIHLEDDVLLAKDALLYFEWVDKYCSYSAMVASATAYNTCSAHDYVQGQGTPQSVNTRKWYNSTAWATWKDRMDLVKDWTGQDKDLLNKLHLTHNMFEVYPFLSRANNIGFINGETSCAQEILDLVGEMAYAPIGRSRTGNYFIEDKDAYKKNLLLKKSDPIIMAQLEKCDKYEFHNQLIVNELGQEFIKLNDTEFKSRDNEEYKQKHYLDFWAGNFDFEVSNYHFCV